MNSLVLRRRPGTLYASAIGINLYGVNPDRMLGLSVAEVERVEVQADGRTVRLSELFEVSDHGREQLEIHGDLSDCTHVGGGMQSGSLAVFGSVGDCLAEHMRGGEIHVRGSAGRFACSSLRGGKVVVDGDAGEYAAAAQPSMKRGMSGGVAVFKGNCGPWLASRMRRGTVVVHGEVAAGAATRMIAGTLVLCSNVCEPFGAGMQRGTVILPGRRASLQARGLPGFTAPGATELSFLPVLARSVTPLLPPEMLSEWEKFNDRGRGILRSVGDRSVGGAAELIWLESSS